MMGACPVYLYDEVPASVKVSSTLLMCFVLTAMLLTIFMIQFVI